jgi:hypothetical protein
MYKYEMRLINNYIQDRVDEFWDLRLNFEEISKVYNQTILAFHYQIDR